MPRNPRFDKPRCLHHGMSRGLACRTILETRADVGFFLSLLTRARRRGELEPRRNSTDSLASTWSMEHSHDNEAYGALVRSALAMVYGYRWRIAEGGNVTEWRRLAPTPYCTPTTPYSDSLGSSTPEWLTLHVGQRSPQPLQRSEAVAREPDRGVPEL